MRQVVILGCGFAGYHAARQIEEAIAGRRRVQLTVVAHRPEFVFSPLLAAVATGELEAEKVTTPLSDLFGPRVDFVQGQVESIDAEAKVLRLADGEIPYDYLLVATGSRRRADVFEGAADLIGPDAYEDTLLLRQRLLTLRAQTPPMRLAIVGGSATGAEWAAALATAMADDELIAGTEELSIELFEAGDRILPDHSESMSDLATRYVESLGVKVHVRAEVSRATNDEVELASGEVRKMDHVFHCAGRGGRQLWPDGVPLDELGFVEAHEDLSVPGLRGVYVAGDAASRGEGIPTTSNPQIAVQQGTWAAKNLLADMIGRATKPFRYDDRGDFITLGRRNAALELRGVILEGPPAWVAYRLSYAALIPRPLQRTNLLMDWITRQLGDVPRA